MGDYIKMGNVYASDTAWLPKGSTRDLFLRQARHRALNHSV